MKRPTKEDPVLGKLEFVSGNGTWWQSIATFGTRRIRLDLEASGRVTAEELQTFSERFTWLVTNESSIRKHAEKALADGTYRSAMTAEELTSRRPPFAHASAAMSMKPYFVSLTASYAHIEFDFDDTSDAHALASKTITVVMNGYDLAYVQLCDHVWYTWAARILDRELPSDLSAYMDSLPDQFVATLASGALGPGKIDAELRKQLRCAIDEVGGPNNRVSAAGKSYLRSVRLLLNDVNSALRPDSAVGDV